MQFDRLNFKQGILHHLCINKDVEYNQMILPIKYQAQVLYMLHDGLGHQGMEQTMTCAGNAFIAIWCIRM